MKKFGLIASRYERSKVEIKEQLSVRLTSQTNLFMFLQSAFQFGQYGNKKERKKERKKEQVGNLKTMFVTHPVPNRTGLNLSFARVIAR